MIRANVGKIEEMQTANSTSDDHHDKIIRSLMRVDSSIRNGQFLYAHREANKLLAELSRGEYHIGSEEVESLTRPIKRTILFLSPMVEAYAQNQASLNVARRISKCKKKQD